MKQQEMIRQQGENSEVLLIFHLVVQVTSVIGQAFKDIKLISVIFDLKFTAAQEIIRRGWQLKDTWLMCLDIIRTPAILEKNNLVRQVNVFNIFRISA